MRMSEGYLIPYGILRRADERSHGGAFKGGIVLRLKYYPTMRFWRPVWVTLLSSLVFLAFVSGCIPQPGFARTPTAGLPTLTAADICADYSRDIEAAANDLRRDLISQIADLTNI